jgi:filamentous hemagglutinin family protein
MSARGHHRRKLLLVSCTALTALYPLHAHPNPQGGAVVAGQASIETPSQGHLVVRQGSARAVIDWRSFSIGAGEHTQFVQPSTSSVALNRVTGPDPSVIAGRLSANGRIVLQNEAGVTFSEGAQVNAASLLATTSRIDAQRLMNTGEVVANLPGRVAGARVENRGDITVADSGVAALVGPEVRNSGRIVARQGRVVLGGAETYTIDLAGDGLVAFEVRDPVARAPSDGGAVVANTGTIEAPGGQVIVSARAARGVVDDVIFAGGRIAATAVRQEGGTIVLGGGDAGTVTVAGNLDVSGTGAGQRGGTVDVRGERIVMRSGSRIDASGRAGGGTVRIGGDLQGRGPGPTAQSVVVERDVTILADATARGDGGTTIVWSDEVTRFWGRISARGGPEGGDGGFAEVSSKGWLDYRGVADLRATLGQVGVLLLDPSNLTISDVDTSGIDFGPPIAPTSGNSILNVNDLQAQLALANVTVTTVASPDTPGETGVIAIVASFVIPDARTLTLEAAGAIQHGAGTTIASSGSSNLVMRSGVGAGGSGGIITAGTIALGPAGILVLDATGGGTGAGGQIAQTGGSLSGAQLLAQAAAQVALNATTFGTIAGSSVGGFDVAGSAGNLTVGTVQGVAGITATGAGASVTLSAAGDLTVGQSIGAGAGNVLLTAGTGGTGSLTQTGGAISGAGLRAQAADAVSINSAAITTVAGSAGGAFSVADTSGGLTVGTVQGVSGITASGAAPSVTLSTPGDLTVSQAITAGTGPVALTTGAGGRLTVNQGVTAGRVAVTADQIAVNAALGSGATGVDIATATAGRNILVGSGTGGSQLGNPGNDSTALAVNQEEFDRLGSATAAVRLGTGSGTIAIQGAPPAGSVGLDLGTRRLFLATGNGSAAAITQTHRVIGAAGSALAAGTPGSVVLTNSGNDVPLIAGRAGGPLTSFAYTATGGVTVGTVLGGGGISDLGGIITTGAPITLSVNGALALNQPLTAPGGTVSLTNAGTAAITQGATGTITATRLAIQTGGPATLTDAANQVTNLGAVTAGGLAFRNVTAATVAARNTGSGAIDITGQNSVTIGSDPLLGVTGVQNLAGAVTLDAAATLLVTEAVSATGTATLLGTQVTVNDIVAAPRVNVAADRLTINPLTGALGTATLTEAVLRTRTAGRPISLGAIAAGELSIGADQLGRIGVGAPSYHLRIGSVGGALRPGEAATGTLTIRGTADFSGRALTLEAGAAGAAVTQDPGDAVFAGSLIARAAQGSVLLGGADNAVGTLAGAALGATSDFEFLGLGNVTLGSLTHGTDAALAGVTAGRTARLGSVFGTVQQTAAAPIAAQSLLARSDFGAVNLTASAANTVGTIAGDAFAGFRYRGADGLTVGTIAPSVAFPGIANGITITSAGAPVTLIAGGDLALAAPIGAGNGTVRLQSGQDLTQAAAGVVTADALLARAGRDVLLDGANGTELPGAPGGTGGNQVGTLAAVAGRELWYRSAQGFTVGSVAADPGLVAGATGASGGPDGVVRLAATNAFGQITVNDAITAPAVELAADLLAINASVGASAAAVVARPFTAGRGVVLGDAAFLDPLFSLVLSAAEIDLLGGASSTLRFGSAGNAGEAASGTLIVRGPGGIRVNRAGQPGDARTVVLESGAAGAGAISQTGPITGGGAATLVAAAPAGEVLLGDTANDVGTIAGTAAAAGFRYRAAGSVTVGQSATVTAGAGTALTINGRDGIRGTVPSLPITLMAGGNLSLARPLDAGTQAIRLEAGGALSQTGAGTLSAGALLARGGSVDLTSAVNAVGVLAGGSVSGFRFRHGGSLTVGALAADPALPVPGQSGVASATGSAPITLVVDGGGLTLTNAVDAGLNPASTVRLQADGTLSQGASGFVIADALLARAGAVLLDQTNLVRSIAGEAPSQFRFRNFSGVTVGEVAGDGTLVAGATGVRLVSGAGTVTVVGGSGGGANGGVVLSRPVDAGSGTVLLEAGAGAGSHVQQTSDGRIDAATLEAVAPAGGVDLASAGAINAVGGITGFGRDGFRFRAVGPLAVGAAGIGTTNAPLTLVSGGGLTLLGPLAAGTGTVRLRALAGDITQSGGTITAGALALSAEGGSIDVSRPGNAFDVFAGAAQGALVFDVAGALTVAAIGADGPAESQVGVVNPAAVLVPGFGGATSSNGEVRITTNGLLTVSGTASAGTDVILTSQQGLTLSGAVVAAGDALLSAVGALTVADTGSIVAGQAVTLDAGGPITIAGSLQAGTTAALDTVQSIAVTASGSVRAAGTATLAAGTTLDVAGTVDAGGSASLGAGDFLSVGGTVQADAAATLTSGGGINVWGTVRAGTDASLTSGTWMIVDGTVQAAGSASLAAGAWLDLGGAVVAGLDATLDAGADLRVLSGGLVRSAGSASLTAATFLVHEGVVDADGNATLTAGQWMWLAGNLVAGGDASVTAGTELHVLGLVAVAGEAALEAGTDLRAFAGAQVLSNGPVTLTATQSLLVEGMIETGADATLTSGQTTTVAAGGAVRAAGAATLVAGSTLAIDGAVAAGAGVGLTAGAALSLSAGGSVTSGADATLAAPGPILVGGELRADGSVILDTPSGISVPGTIGAGANAALSAGQAIAVAGMIEAGGAATLVAGSTLTIDGAVAAGADVDLTAGAALSLNAGGSVTSGADATLAAPGPILVGGDVRAAGFVTLDTPGAIDVPGTIAAGANAALRAGQDIAVAGAVEAGGAATLVAGQAIAVPGRVLAGLDAVLDAATALSDSGTISAGRDAILTAGQAMTIAGTSVLAGRDAVLTTSGSLTIIGRIEAGRDVILSSGLDVTIPGIVLAGADTLIGAAREMRIAGSVGAGSGGLLILGFGTDFTLEGQLGAPDGRVMIRRAAPLVAGSTGTITLDGGGQQFSLGGTPEMIVIDASGDLRPLGTPDPGIDVGRLRSTLAGLILQTPDQIAATRVVRLFGFPSFAARVTGTVTQFGQAGADAVQSTVDLSLGAINAPNALLYVFGENGSVTSNPGFVNALTLRAVGIYVNEAAEVSIFGVINGVAGDNASTFVQRLGDPQFRQRINDCAIGTIGCTFLPLSQEPAIYIPPVVLLEGAAPRFDESSVPIVNTGPEDVLRPGGEADEDGRDENATVSPAEGRAG